MCKTLQGLPLGEIVVRQQTGSTNDEAIRLALAGAPDGTLVVADEQTAGRGRAGRRWLTPSGSALALSLVLRPSAAAEDVAAMFPGRYAALGALAVCTALEQVAALSAAIKWPNDVLLNGCKVAGVLPEAHWVGSQPSFVVLGIGVNVLPASVPPTDRLDFPATCVAWEASHPVARLPLLRAVVAGVLCWRNHLADDDFLQAWESRLAFRGQRVEVTLPHGDRQSGILLGLDAAGHLLVRDDGNRLHRLLQVTHLRPCEGERTPGRSSNGNLSPSGD